MKELKHLDYFNNLELSNLTDCQELSLLSFSLLWILSLILFFSFNTCLKGDIAKVLRL